jgi:hypothetical protein
MQMFVCVRARDGRPTLVQLTRKFACTNWFGSGRVKISPLSMGRVGSRFRWVGSGPKKVTRRQL